MAVNQQDQHLSIQFNDIRAQKRNRTLQVKATMTPAEAQAIVDDFHIAGQCDVIAHSLRQKYVEDSPVGADADSEVSDTTRLYFRLADLTTCHLDIVDADASIFVGLTGQNALNVLPYADLTLDPPKLAVKGIIDAVLAGDILISDGETPTTYVEGIRI